MNKKIAILRGINVGGKRKILMADLKLLFKALGFENIVTYIQSGNVFFDSNDNLSEIEIADKIEIAIKEKYGFDVPIIVTTHDFIQNAIHNNPFNKTAETDIKQLHLTFLNAEPTAENLALVRTFNYEPDQFNINKKAVFIYCQGKYHQSKLTNNFFEKKLKVNATTRNWKTVLKLLELSRS